MFCTTFVFMCKVKSDCLSCYLSHVIFYISHVKCQRSNAYFDPWYMLNNFCFHVYAQKSLIISEIGNEYFSTASSAREFGVHKAGSHLKSHGVMGNINVHGLST